MARVAIVDDSKDSLEIFKIVLEGSHEFLAFDDPHVFLKDFRPGSYALILLDLAMPQMDGFEVFRHIREQDRIVPVVAITAIAHDEERQKALRSGFCDYFTKPVMEIDKFRDAVYSHVGECSNPPHAA